LDGIRKEIADLSYNFYLTSSGFCAFKMEFRQKVTGIFHSIRVQGHEFKNLSDAQNSGPLALELQTQSATPANNTRINVARNKEFEYYRVLLDDNNATTRQLYDEFRK